MSVIPSSPRNPYAKRVRTKTYSIGLFLVGGLILIEFASLVSVFLLRHAVKIDLDAPMLAASVHLPSTPETTPALPETAAPALSPNLPIVPPIVPRPFPPLTGAVPLPAPGLGLPEVGPIVAAREPSLLQPSTGQRLNLKSVMDPHDQVLALNREAEKFRMDGDFDLARAALLEAENKDPNDLLTLQSQAGLAEAMNEQHRAVVYWQRIYSLGSQIGEDLHALAGKKVEELSRPVLPPTLPPEVGNDRIFVTGAIQQTVLADKEIYELKMAIPIVLQDAGADVRPSDISIKLFFYDLTETGEIVPTKARRTVAFENANPSWINTKTEVLKADYRLNLATTTSKFYGYLFRIYYDGKLQDEQAMPHRLLSLFPSGPPSTLP